MLGSLKISQISYRSMDKNSDVWKSYKSTPQIKDGPNKNQVLKNI